VTPPPPSPTLPGRTAPGPAGHDGDACPPAAELDATAGLAVRLRLAIARVHRRARQEAITTGDDLTATRLAALATIENHGPLTLGDLAAMEQVQPPSMTRIVARLEEQGFVAREVDPDDRRVSRVRLTPTGLDIL